MCFKSLETSKQIKMTLKDLSLNGSVYEFVVSMIILKVALSV